jgi:hypothetical protein
VGLLTFAQGNLRLHPYPAVSDVFQQARKNFRRYTRGLKRKIRARAIARDTHENFVSISRSLESALEAIMRDFNFLRQVAIFSHDDLARSNFSSRSKQNFRSH